MKAEAGREDQVDTEDTERNSVAAATRAEVDMATRLRTKAEVAATGLICRWKRKAQKGYGQKRKCGDFYKTCLVQGFENGQRPKFMFRNFNYPPP